MIQFLLSYRNWIYNEQNQFRIGMGSKTEPSFRNSWGSRYSIVHAGTDPFWPGSCFSCLWSFRWNWLTLPPVLLSLQSYVVYLGAHSHGPSATTADYEKVTDSHHDFLESFLERWGIAIKMFLFSICSLSHFKFNRRTSS